MSDRRRRRRLLVTGVATLTAMTMLANSAPAQAAPPRPAKAHWRAAAADRAVKGYSLAPKATKARELRSIASVPATANKVTGGRRTVAVATGTSAALVGGLRVQASPIARTAAPSELQVTVADRTVTDRLKVSGAVLQFAPSSTGTPDAAVSIDYTALAAQVSPGLADRLKIYRLTGCPAFTTATASNCGSRVQMPARHDLAAHRFTVTIKGTGAATSSSAFATGSAQLTTLAVAASASGAAGDYGATSLARSATWQAGDSAGSFTWSYPIPVPPTQGGPTPQLALTYSSSAVDGHTASTNNQPSWIGEGFDLTSNYIERRYQSCADNDTTYKSGDRCWAGDNASLSLNGKSSELVYDGTSKLWHMKEDDGTKIEKLLGAANGDLGTAGVDGIGEYWKVTDTSGTQYIFGVNRLPGWVTGKTVTNSVDTVPVFGNNAGEPCHAATFDPGYCSAQAWRWNLDRVVDPDGNSMAYYYAKQQSAYGRNLTPTKKSVYDIGSYLSRIDYGMRSGAEYSTTTPPTQQVLFAVADRCVTAGATCTKASANWSNWPDVPWDQYCDPATTVTSCSDLTPTFFTTKMLSSINSRVLTGVTSGVASYQNADSYSLIHTFPNPNYGTAPKTNAALWLSRIRHTGQNGTAITLPDVIFSGTPMANRVNRASDGLPPMNSFRINSIRSESGDVLSVSYSGSGQGNDPGAAQECTASNIDSITASSNTMRCYPAWYDPYSTTKADWFRKYLVLQVVDDPVSALDESLVTSYEYRGNPAWSLDDDDLTPTKKKLYGHWRGYGVVRTISGDVAVDPSEPRGVTDTTYFRGLGGTVNDSVGSSHSDTLEKTGRTLESVTYDGMNSMGSLGRALTSTITDYWASAAQATRGTYIAKMVRPQTSTVRTWLPDSSSWRTARTTTAYNGFGMATTVDDEGDLSDPNDAQCTTTTYAAANTTAWLVDEIARSATVAARCGATPAFPDAAMSDTRYYYDGGAYGAAPTKGRATKVETLHDYSGGTPHYVTSALTVYDANGRVTQSTDVLNRVTKTAFTPATGGPVTGATTTDAMGFVTVNTLDRVTGNPTKTTDPNAKVTELTYDSLGRLTQVWQPNWSRASHGAVPSYQFAYSLGTIPGDTTQANGANYTAKSSMNANGSGYTTAYTLLDGMLRPRQTQVVAPGTMRLIEDTFYNSRGLVIKTYDGYAAAGSPSGVLFTTTDNQVDAQTWTLYDGADRPTAVIDAPLGVEKVRTTTVYRGDHTDTLPAPGGWATSTYNDSRGRAVQSRIYRGPTVSGSYDTTSYTFTPAGNLATVTDPGGSTWRYSYDVRGLQTDAFDPDKGHTQTVYDDAGRETSTTDAKGNTVVTTYDNADRTKAVYKDSTAGQMLQSYEYDTLAKGQLTSSSSWNGTDEYKTTVLGYNNLYQSTGETLTIPAGEGPLAGSYTTNHFYLVNGLRNSDSLPAVGSWARESVGYDYNSLKQPVGVGSSAVGTIVSSATYTAFGELATMHADRGSSQALDQTFSYAPGSRQLQRRMVTQPYTSAVIADQSFTYGPTGDLLKQSDAKSGDVQCFSSDGIRRLTQAWTPANQDCTGGPSSGNLGGPAPYWQSWTHGVNGSRATETTHGVGGAADVTDTYGYPAPTAPQPHGMTSVSSSGGSPVAGAYTWDASGSLSSRPGHTYTWDTLGHLATDTTSAGVTSYLYGPGGDRLIRHDKDGSTLYFGETELRYQAGSVSPTRYYHLGDETVAVRSDAGVTWTVNDLHNTGLVSVDANDTTVVKRRFQTPYGASRDGGALIVGSHSFVDGVSDPEGTVHLGAREYLPTTGQFLSVDPVIDYADPQQLNPYSYAHNDPVNAWDPTGLRLDSDTGGAGYSAGSSGRSSSSTSSSSTSVSGNSATVTTTVATKTSTGTTYSKTTQVYTFDPPKPPKPKPWWQKAIKFIGDITGINDVIGCIRNPSVGGCVMAAIAVATTFMPAAKGILIAAKAARTGMKVAREAEALGAVARTEHAAAEVCKLNSFDPSTKVVLASGGTKAIGAVKIGDLVLASDPVSGTTKAEPVTDTIRGIGNKNLVDVTVTDKAGRGSTLVATDEHPFWVPDTATWTAAKDLKTGQQLVTFTGHGPMTVSATVTAMASHVRFQEVYNLTVRELHTYYVRTSGGVNVLVHNCGAAKTGASGADDVLNGVRLRAQLTGQEISGGHAFGKHVGEFPGITTRGQFASHIEDVVTNGVMRPLSNGRSAYWQNGTVVIRNPNAVDGGTAFRPTSGYDYFLNLH